LGHYWEKATSNSGRSSWATTARCSPEGALTEREKALIALAVAHTVQCPYCIDAYTQASLEKGSNVEEMTEAVHVACAIRGGASLVHGVQMRNVAEKLSM
jgi:4-carboxymuconolactone decarboxylase